MRCRSISLLIIGVLTLVVGASFGMGCAGTKMSGGPTSSTDSLVGREWVLNQVAGKPVPGDVRAFIRFAPDGKLTGAGGCNQFFGSYTFDSGKLTIGPLGATKMMCPPEIMKVEYPYLATLTGVLKMVIDNKTLTLCPGDKNSCLVFTSE